LLINSNGTIAYSTTDHTPTNKSEKARVERAGDSITESGYVQSKDSVSTKSNTPATRMFAFSIFVPKSVTAEPEIKEIPISRNNRFLVLGSRNLFRALSNDQVRDVVMQNANNNPQEIVNKLVQKAKSARPDYEDDRFRVIVVDLSSAWSK